MCPGHLREGTGPGLQPILPLKKTKSAVMTDPHLSWCALPQAGVWVPAGLRRQHAVGRGCAGLCLSVSNSQSLATRGRRLGRRMAGVPLLPSRLVILGKSYRLASTNGHMCPGPGRRLCLLVGMSGEALSGLSRPSGCVCGVPVGKPHGGDETKLLPSVSLPACLREPPLPLQTP